MSTTEDLVEVYHCLSPVVVSVPHDGLPAAYFKRFRERRGFTFSEPYTSEVARLLNIPTPQVTLVRGLGNRLYLDYNRKGVDATHEPELTLSYHAYHFAVASALKDGAERFERSLLVDLHGFVRQPAFGEYDVILGTCHRQTVNTDVDKKLGWFLEESGYKTFVPSEQRMRGEILIGGFTVRHHAGKGIDAIQLEVHMRHYKTGHLRRRLALVLREFFGSQI